MLLEPEKKGGKGGDGFDVMKSGDARVALIVRFSFSPLALPFSLPPIPRLGCAPKDERQWWRSARLEDQVFVC